MYAFIFIHLYYAKFSLSIKWESLLLKVEKEINKMKLKISKEMS